MAQNSVSVGRLNQQFDYNTRGHSSVNDDKNFAFQMDPTTSTWYLGAVHAAFNSTELFAIILFGAWVQYRSGFEPLVFSLVSMIIGSALYAWALSFGYVGKFLVLVARMFIGCSTGLLVVLHAF